MIEREVRSDDWLSVFARSAKIAEQEAVAGLRNQKK